MKLAYYADLTLIDRKIGAVLEPLKEKGLYNDTPDPFYLGPRDLWDLGGHQGAVPAEALVRILLRKPPAAGYPGRTGGFLCELGGDRGHLPYRGRAGRAREHAAAQPDGILHRPPARSGGARCILRRGICGACGGERHKLVYYAGRQYGEFYDLQADPGERYNLWRRRRPRRKSGECWTGCWTG